MLPPIISINTVFQTEHGDARRGIDLLRVAGEVAGIEGEKLAKAHVDLIGERLQTDTLFELQIIFVILLAREEIASTFQAEPVVL